MPKSKQSEREFYEVYRVDGICAVDYPDGSTGLYKTREDAERCSEKIRGEKNLCGKGENPGYIILAMTGDNYVTWWMRESDSVCVQENYFSMEEFEEAVEDFFSRQ